MYRLNCAALLLGMLFIAGGSGCGSDVTTDLSLAGGAGGAGATGTTTTGPGTTGPATTGPGSGPGGGSDTTGDSFSVSFGPITVQPGTERTQCVVKRLGNPAALHVGQIHNVLNGPSHHLIVYRTADTEEKLEPFDCQPFTDTLDPSKGSPLMITQKHEETLELPKGVAFTLEPNQMIRLEMHYLNTNPAPIDLTGTSTFIPIPDAEFENEADFLFIGDPDIKIPANSAQTLGPIFINLPSNLDGVNFFGITGHTHQWGTNVKVSTSDSKGGTDTPIYDVENWTWSEPATVYLDPPVKLPDAGGFRFSCSWENKSSNTASFGESANDEMCFFWAYYYPSKGAYVCVHTDQVAGGFDLCCPGSPICDQIF